MRFKVFSLLISFFIFIGALEGISWIFLAADFQNSHVVQFPMSVSNREEIAKHLMGQNRVSEVLRNYVAWEEKHPEILNWVSVDDKFRLEASRYVHQGARHSKHLFADFDLLERNINDEFSAYGASSGKLKFKVSYKTDSAGRRVTGYENIPEARMNLIFIGCSFTFGEGLTETSTIPSVVGKLLPFARTYNLGVPGSSPSQRLASLRKSKKLLEGIDSRLPTYIIFTFIDDHLRRVVGSSAFIKYVPTFYEKAPEFYLKNNKLQMHRNFLQRNKFWRDFIVFYSSTNFAKFTHFELPLIRDDHFELLAKIMSEIKYEVRSVLPETKDIYFAGFPDQDFYFKKLIPYMHQEGVKTLDYTGINYPALMRNHFHLKTDVHPSDKAYDLYANLLIADLKKELNF